MSDPRVKLLLGVLLQVLGVAVTWQAWKDIVRIGVSDSSSSYILVIPAVAGLLAWVRRRELAAAAGEGGGWGEGWWGGVVVLLGLGAFWASYPLRMDTLWYASPVLVIVGGLWAVWGGRVVRRAWPSVLLLFFLIPVPAVAGQWVAVPLQWLASVATTEVLNTVGVPVKRLGNLLVINGESVNVAEACSGMRSTFALMVLMYVFAFVQRLRWPVRLLLLGSVPVVAVVCNLVRLVPVTLAHGYGSEMLADQLHDVLGFVVFVVAVLLCQVVVSSLKWAGLRVRQRAAGGEAVAKGGGREGGGGSGGGVVGRQWGALPSASLSGLILAVGALVVYSPASTQAATAYHARVARAVRAMPMQLAGWEGRVVPLTAPAEEMLKPNAVYSVEFVHPTTRQSFRVSLIQCAYARDMHYHEPRVCYPNSGWQMGMLKEVDWPVKFGTVEGAEYIFRQVLEERLQQIYVNNFFVMPDGHIVRWAETVRERIKLPWVDRFGVTQVQLVFSSSFSEESRRELTEAFLESNWGTLQVIQSGIRS